MRILLINVCGQPQVRIPQGLLYLASAVHAAGHEVFVHDEALVSDPKKTLEHIISCDPDVIGLSVYTFPRQLRRTEQLSQTIKNLRKTTPIIWGGWHATLYPEQSIANEYVDIVVRGPGEKPLCEILNALEKNQSLKTIPGLVLKEDGRVIDTGPECLDPEYLYPPLNFELIRLDAYLKKHDRGAGTLQYITTRGCSARCNFCLMSRVFKRHLIRKPRTQILRELKYIFEHHHISSIHFSDDNTFRNENEALQLCNLVADVTHGKHIPWRCATRISTLSNLSPQTCRKLSDAGCRGVVVGIESGSDRVLQLMGKQITVAHTQKALKALADAGLKKNLFFFLFNFNGETKTDALQTVRLARKTRMMFPESDIQLNVFFPGASFETIPFDSSESKSNPMSKILDQYYEQHIRTYRMGRIHIKILRYYLNAGTHKDQPNRVKSLTNIYRKLIWLRIKYGIFALPFEYHLSNTVLRKISRILSQRNINKNTQDALKEIE